MTFLTNATERVEDVLILRFSPASLIAILTMVFSVGSCLHAQSTGFPSTICDDDTTVVGRMDAAALKTLLNELSKEAGIVSGEATVLEKKLRQTEEILGDEVIWLTANWPRIPSKITLFVADEDGTRIDRLVNLWNFQSSKIYATKRYTLSLKAIRKGEIQSTETAGSDWSNSFAEVRKGSINFAMKPPKYFYRALDELLNELPEYLGGGPVDMLTKGALSANVAIDLSSQKMSGFIESASKVHASELSEYLPRMLDSAIKNINGESNNPLTNILETIANRSSFTAQQNRVQIQFKSPEAGAATSAALVQQVLKVCIGPAARQSQMEKLRNAAIGILNYESANRCFPPPEDSRGEKRRSSLSWRVHILPFLGESELWQKFNLDEPWDSPTNKKLLPQMPAIYSRFSSQLMMPADAPKGLTTLVAPISDRTILGAPQRVAFGNISDGSSNTVLLVCVDDSLAVPWTAPRDYKFDPDNAAAGLQFENGKALIAMCDGSTLIADRKNQWRYLFEMNDGNVAQVKQ